MSVCHVIEKFTLAPPATLESTLARDWLDHVAECEQCAARLSEAPEAALLLIEQSHSDGVDPGEELAPMHAERLALGQVLARRLGESVHAELSAEEGIEPLRYELRHAPDIDEATVAEIRAAVALSELSHAFEGLVFQDDEGYRPIVLGDQVVWAGDDEVSLDYFTARIMEAISCGKEAANEFLEVLSAVLREGILAIPGFSSIVDGVHIRLDHEDDLGAGVHSPFDDVREDRPGAFDTPARLAARPREDRPRSTDLPARPRAASSSGRMPVVAGPRTTKTPSS